MEQATAEVQDYVLNVMPKINSEIQQRCQSGLSTVQVLGFTEVAFNSLLVGSGLLGGSLSIRWPKSSKQLAQAKKITNHDWFLLPSRKPLVKSPADVYVSGLKTANILFKYLLDNYDSKMVDQILQQAMNKGLSSAADKQLHVDAQSNPQYYLISYSK